ncbi:hypothetical protein GPEL0_01r4732 [Geoanaerobacter pelophilus]|uniref:Uncharacterized protein n=1 Tax=Geoanaerobacter pelophilus TaxID=60036 RepID=A0ABQ0MN52_9BACT|nr:hypothetical protein [Geoanaerobacter pelophilus]GAW68399.1 hypothetical protein GPEL0_01r4732 [Geoanaerobacter pelophilus]
MSKNKDLTPRLETPNTPLGAIAAHITPRRSRAALLYEQSRKRKIMPITTLWGLVVSLALLALGVTYKLAEIGHSLKKANEDTDSLRKKLMTLEDSSKNESLSLRTEIDSLKEVHSKEIMDIHGLHQRETEELRKKLVQNSSSHDALSEQTIALLHAIAILENEYKKTTGYQDYYTLSEITFSKNLQISPQKLRFLLEQLLSANLIHKYPSGKFGGLKPNGRKLLHEKDLLP